MIAFVVYYTQSNNTCTHTPPKKTQKDAFVFLFDKLTLQNAFSQSKYLHISKKMCIFADYFKLTHKIRTIFVQFSAALLENNYLLII